LVGKTVIVTHTDLDGVASAAIYHRVIGTIPDVETTVVMTEPYRLHRVLRQVAVQRVERIAIMDLGPNASTFEDTVAALAEAIEGGARVEWYDHHRWNDEWRERLTQLGVKLFIDTTMCAAGVVATYASKLYEVEVDEFTKKLVSATCAADLWRWDDDLAPRLYRVIDRYRGARGDEWKRKLIRGFFEGALWWPDLDEALNEYLRLEFRGFNKALRNTVVEEVAPGCRAVFVLKDPGPPNASILGNALLDRFDADFAVIVRRRGRGISLRSRNVNVREIAYRLGGGGHPKAAGAPLNLPFLYRLASLFYPKTRLAYARKLVEAAVREAGGCPRL